MCGNIVDAVLKNKIIAIVRGVPKESLIALAEAFFDGGIRLLEITYSADAAVSDEQTAENIRMLKEHFGSRMFIGAGTVLAEKQAELTKAAGGEFIISPDTVPCVIKRTKELGMASIPGAYTPSEITLAQRCGADFVKVFPAVNLGPDYIKAVRAPLSHIKLLAVGGITCDNIPQYLKAGVCGFGIGGSLTDKRLIANGDFAEISKLAKKYVSLVNGDQNEKLHNN